MYFVDNLTLPLTLFLPQAHKDAHLTEAEAADFSVLYLNYSFNLNLPSSIETKVVKCNIAVNKLN